MYEKKPQELQAQLKFILKIANGGYFRIIDEILLDEFVSNMGTDAQVIWTGDTLEQFCSGVLDRDFIPQYGNLWRSNKVDRLALQDHKNSQYHIYSKLRKDLPSLLKAKRNPQKLSSLKFEKFLSAELDFHGRNVIAQLFADYQFQYLQDQWSNDKSRYPFLTAVVEGYCYMLFHAAIKQNRRLDRNAEADSQQLVFLHHADLIVSNDEQFMRDAFCELWQPKGKKLQTVEQFVAFIADL